MLKKRYYSLSGASHDVSIPTIILNCFFHFLIFCLFALLLLVISSLILFNLENPGEYSVFASRAVLYLSVTLTSCILARRIKQKLVISGLIFGLITTIFTLLVSIFLSNSVSSPAYTWFLLIPIFSLLGCFLGKEREKKHKRWKR